MKKYLKRFSLGCIVILALLVLCRNYLAKAVIESAGSYFLQNSVSVSKISIGWRDIRIVGLAVRERRLDDQLQLTLGEIHAQPTLLTGLRTGVWLERLSVVNPHFYLRFDAAGNLLSHFPPAGETKETGSGPFTIPVTHAVVSGAALSVLQQGKSTLEISEFDCEVLSREQITVRTRIGDVLGSSFVFNSQLDASTLAGKTSLELQPLILDCKQLSKLPFVPSALRDIDFRASLSCTATLEHPPSDLDPRNHNLALNVDIQQMQGNEISSAVSKPDTIQELYSSYLASGMGNHVSLRARNKQGNCSLLITGPVSGGSVHLNAATDLKSNVPQVDGTLRIASVDIGRIAKIVAAEQSIEATLNVAGKLNATLRDQVVAFDSVIAPTLSDICAARICVDPIAARLTTRGTYTLATAKLDGQADVSVKSTGVDLASIGKLTGLSELAGRASIFAGAHIPLATLDKPETFSASFHTDTPDLSIAGFGARRTRLHASLRDGNIAVALAETRISPQPTELRSPDSIASVSQIGQPSSLRVTASATARILTAAQINGWDAQVTLQASDVSVAGQRLQDFTLSPTMVGGEITLPQADIVWKNTRCKVSGSGKVQDVLGLQFDAQPILLSDIGHTASQFSNQRLDMTGTARAEGIASFDTRDGRFQANGFLDLQKAVVQKLAVGSTRLAWSASPEAVQLQSSSTDFLGGNYACGAMLTSFDWTTTQITGNFRGISIERLAAPAKLPAKIGGYLDGQFEVDSIASLDQLRASARISTRDARLGNVPLSFQTRKLSIAAGKIQLAANTEISGGSISVTASTNIAAMQTWQDSGAQPSKIPILASVQSTPIMAQPLIATFDRSRQLRSVRASVGISASRDLAAIENGLWGTLAATVDQLSYRNSNLASRLQADIVARPSGIQVRSISGKVAGGSLQGEVDLSVTPNLSGRYRLSIDGMNLRRALAPIPQARSVTGSLSASASGRIGDLTTANIRLKTSNVVAGGLAIREFRMPLTADYQIRSDRATWRTRGASAQIGGGTISIDSEGNLARGLASFNTAVNISRLDTTKMLRGKSLNAGVIDGSLKLRAKRARAAGDIVGNFHIQLSQLQGFEVPGFDQLLQLAKMPSFTANKLGENDLGIIDGRIGGGMIHVDEGTLSKSGIVVLLNGTSTLAGRLNMDVTAITNPSGPADGLVDLANSPLMMAAPAPVALIAKANDALKDRVIYVAVTGTSNRPTLHLQPGKSLSQNTLRFILSTAVGNQAANMAVRRPSQDTTR